MPTKVDRPGAFELSDVILNPINNLYIKGMNNFSKYSETEQKWTGDFQLKNNYSIKFCLKELVHKNIH